MLQSATPNENNFHFSGYVVICYFQVKTTHNIVKIWYGNCTHVILMLSCCGEFDMNVYSVSFENISLDEVECDINIVNV